MTLTVLKTVATSYEPLFFWYIINRDNKQCLDPFIKTFCNVQKHALCMFNHLSLTNKLHSAGDINSTNLLVINSNYSNY